MIEEDGTENIREKVAADFLARVPEYVERLTWPRSRLKEERVRLLRALVRRAKERSPWHRGRLAEIDPETLVEEDLPRKVPVMTKGDLMTHWDEIVTDERLSLARAEEHLETHPRDLSYLLDQFIVTSSGGSSGRRGIFVWDLRSLVAFSLHGHTRFIRRYITEHRLGLPNPQVIAFVGGGSAAHLSFVGYRTFSYPGVKNRILDVTRPLAELVEELNRIQPTRLDGYPSALSLLAGEASAGRLHIRPQLILAQAEPLYPHIRRALESAWPTVPIFSHYGSSESGVVAVTCGVDRSGRMHLVEDGVIIEPVDAVGRPVPPGVRSAKIYVTNLVNPLLPVIRCEVTDQVMILDDGEGPRPSCSCGCTFRTVGDVRGRLEDVFVYDLGDGGTLSADVDIFETPLNEYRNIVEYQVCQTPKGADVRLVSKGDVDVIRVRSDIQEGLERIGLRDATVTVQRVERIERTRTGKRRRYVPLARGGR